MINFVKKSGERVEKVMEAISMEQAATVITNVSMIKSFKQSSKGQFIRKRDKVEENG